MPLMRHEISLPADYDMGIIRRRVEKAAPLLDDFEGLALKAYLIREGAVNQCAPFYRWHDVDAMNRFLWIGGDPRGVAVDPGHAVDHDPR